MIPVELGSGESWTASIAFNEKDAEVMVLAAGEYEITVKYYAKSRTLLAGAAEDLTTNVLKVTVGE